MTLKLPPPPNLAKADQALNRWLIEITSMLNSAGLVQTGNVQNLPETINQVDGNTSDIETLQPEVAGNTEDITTLQGEVSTNTANIATLQGQVAGLLLRPTVRSGTGVPAAGLGLVGDWYADTTGLHIYVKTAPTVWALIV